MTKTVSRDSFVVLKLGEDYYLEDFYESYDEDEENYTTTFNPQRAYRFYDQEDVPKYAWNHKKQESIDTIEDLLEYLEGELVEIEVVKTTEIKKKPCKAKDLKAHSENSLNTAN